MGEHEIDEAVKKCFGQSIWRIGRILVDMCGVYGRRGDFLGERKHEMETLTSEGASEYLRKEAICSGV